VSLTLERFDDLTENDKDELFKNSIQSYIEYSEELKQKGKKVAIKIISDAWRTYKSRLVKSWRNKMNPFNMYKDLIEEDRERFIAKFEFEDFSANSQYMKWLRSQNKLDHHLSNTGYAKK
jgi:hypothetical protein